MSIDPNSEHLRRAIEVYPHPATVALFKLGRIFKFKKGSPEQRRPQMLQYVHAIESLATSPVPLHVVVNDDWKRLRQDVERAHHQFELNRAEDQIDAVMCAYIALYAARRPDDVTIYGDYPANGYILTPTLPPDLKVTPRPPPAAATTATAGAAHRPLSPGITTERERCARLAAAVTSTWTDIDRKIRELVSPQTSDATAVVSNRWHKSRTYSRAPNEN